MTSEAHTLFGAFTGHGDRCNAINLLLGADQHRKNRGLFSEKRETGARPMKGAEYGGLCTVRQLRVDVYGYCAPA